MATTPKTLGAYRFITIIWGQPSSFFTNTNITDVASFEVAFIAQAEAEGISLGENYTGRGAGQARSQSVVRFRQVRKPLTFWVALAERAGYNLSKLTN